jgi:hypothetical protein
MKIKTLLAFAFATLLLGCGGTDPISPSADAPAPTPVPFVLPDPVNILFVGNSYTFGRVAPVIQYNTATVSDLTASFNERSTHTNAWPVGSGLPPTPCVTTTTSLGCFEAKPWGGVPAIFKSLTDQASLNYVVSHSLRAAASLRGQFLNIADAQWDLRGNMAKQKWDVVVVQGQSDEPLPPTKAKNGSPVEFATYAKVIADYVNTGVGGTTTENIIFNSFSASCTSLTTATVPGAGLGGSCTRSRFIPTNTFANLEAKVFLMQTWARPDMVEEHKCTVADQSTLDGSPKVDATCSAGTNGSALTGMNTRYYTSKPTTTANLADMTADMQSIFATVAASTRTTGEPRFAGVLPVGNAFQQAVNSGVVKGSDFYKRDGTFDDSGTQMNLWWKDATHASKFGSYLSALVTFGRITGLNPTRFDGLDRAAADLGISRSQAQTLQGVARDTLVAAGVVLR